MIKAKNLQDLFKRYRRPGDIVFAILFLAFSIFLLVNLGDQTKWAPRTKLMAQPAFWPYVAVLTMTIFGGLHLISGLISEKLSGRWIEVQFWLRSLEFAGWFMGYVAIVPWVGYLPGTILFTVLLTLRLGYREAKMLFAAAGFGAVVVIVFKSLLQVKVPGGQIYEYLPTAMRSFMLTYF